MAGVWKGFVIIIGFNTVLVCFGQIGKTLNCDFEEGYCGWSTSESDKPWQRSKLKSPTSGTGPESGHTEIANNYYIFLHAADFKNEVVVEPGKCVLASPRFNTSENGGCLSWFMHMYGTGLGNLTVEVFDTERPHIHDSYKKSARLWQCGYLPLSSNRFVQIKFTAYTGTNVYGDIALDDIQYADGACPTDLCSWGTVITNPTSPSTSATDVVSGTKPTEDSGTTLANAISTPPGGDTPPVTVIVVAVAVSAVIIIVIAAIIGFIMYRRSKQKDKAPISMEVEQTDYQDAEDAYDLLDDDKILPMKTDEAGYTVPVDNPAQLPPPASPTDENYITMNMRSETDDNYNYVETVPGPNEIAKTSDLAQGAEKSLQGEQNPGFLGDNLELYENVERESFYENQEMAPPPCGKKKR